MYETLQANQNNMNRIIKTRKGLNIPLAGAAELRNVGFVAGETYALLPDDFTGIVPKVVVKVGDKVKAGTPLFVDKASPTLRFASPVAGEVVAIERGNRRKVEKICVKAADNQESADFGSHDLKSMTGEEVKTLLTDAGLFGYISRLPFAVVAHPDEQPKGIFVSALRDKPLAADFDFELKGNESAFQTGLTALSKIAKTWLGIGPKQTADSLVNAKDVEVTVFDGPCPAGNVGVQVNKLDPVNKGEVVWIVDPTAVIFFGRLFETGKVDLTRRVAIAGSEVNNPAYCDALVGTALKDLLKVVDGKIEIGKTESKDAPTPTGLRIINGNPLTGKRDSLDGYLGAHTSTVSVIPEGDHEDEALGWIMPRTSQFSSSKSYFSWLMPKRKFNADARIKGGQRHMIMSGEYDKVLPMDIYGEYLIKAIIAGDIDRMEQLGIYEVSPEDFALAEFVDSSKLELQKIVREGLDKMRNEL